MNILRLAKGISLAFAIASSAITTAQAGFVFTIEGPGVQQSSVPGVMTEDFDDGTLVSALGTYTGSASISAADVYGGAGGAGYYMRPFNDSDAVLTLNSPQTYFGLWWSAGNVPNTLSFYDPSDSLLGSYTVGDIIPFLSPGYFGNPNGGGNAGEPYVYLNFTATGADTISRVVFGGGYTFESDNHSVYDQPITPPGQNPVPESGATLPLTAIAMGVVLGLRRLLTA